MSSLIPFYVGGAVATAMTSHLIHQTTIPQAVIAGVGWPVWVVWAIIEEIKS